MLKKFCVGLMLIGTMVISIGYITNSNTSAKETSVNNNISVKTENPVKNSEDEENVKNIEDQKNVKSTAKTDNVVNENKSDISYKVVSETYNNKGTKITYPQITDLKDSSKQKQLNEIIKSEALKGTNYYKDIDGNVSIDINYKVVCQESEIISIIYSGVGNVTGAAHPSNLFYTTNIDIPNMKKLTLKDIVDVNDGFVNMFLKENGKFKAVTSEYEAQYRSDMAMSNQDEWKARLLAADPLDNMGSEFTYMTKDSLGISIGVIHALGDHAEFEVKYKDISEYIKLKKLLKN